MANIMDDRWIAWIERVILELADEFDIRVFWNRNAAIIITGSLAMSCGLVGAFVGGYVGVRIGVALGASICQAAGLSPISLREIWDIVKEKLRELFYIVYNYLRNLDPEDVARAYSILMGCLRNRQEVVTRMIDFLMVRLGRAALMNMNSS